MLLRPSLTRCALALLSLLLASPTYAHIVISYPGWRGDNLHTNGTVEETNGVGMGYNGSDPVWPYGMQWQYPCGGMGITTNRTKWPVQGGAVSWQPGWFQGHATAFTYINLGFGSVPANYNFPMVSAFQIVGPSALPYPGTVCLPQVPLPAGANVSVGDNATIQMIETAVHGAALYSCVDITFAEPEDVAEVNASNCFNSSDIGFELVFTTTALTDTAISSITSPSFSFFAVPVALAALFGLMI